MYYLIFNTISQYYRVLHFQVNNQLKVALVNKRDFFQNHKTNKQTN